MSEDECKCFRFAADVIWRAGRGDDTEMAKLLIGHAANVGQAVKVFSESGVASAVH